MKYLMMILALMLSANVAIAANDYPGQGPNWNQRFTVSCSMINNQTDAVSYMFSHGSLDYPQAGSLVFSLQQGQAAWYEALRDKVEGEGFDMRLFPLSKNQIKELIEIERIMSGKFDE